MKRYVTYDDAGQLTGAYMQEPHADHIGALIEVSAEVALAWTALRANAARDGVEPVAVTPPSLTSEIALALEQTYRDVDAVYDAAVGKREPEYRDAEAAARAFVAAGYEGDADEDVSEFALHNPTRVEQTNQWAANQIIARADAFRNAQKLMRSTRFARQADMRAAVTVDQLAGAVASWDEFIAGVRAQLGLQ
ncbi:MAG: hypothetical protein ACXW2U_08950 [Telluria sp.]